MKLILWLCLLLVFWNSFLADGGKTPGPPRVLTQNGELQGQRIRVRGAERDVEVFLGVPYAKSPTGSLRFSPPQLAEPWTGLRDATSYPPMCLQDPLVGQALSDAFANTGQRISFTMTEDCLYLNIYVPAHTDKAEQLPVMVWIHGGGLVLGAASTYDGSVLSAYENVVVVAIQYRLGILGFYRWIDLRKAACQIPKSNTAIQLGEGGLGFDLLALPVSTDILQPRSWH